MSHSKMQYLPVAGPIFLLLVLLFVVFHQGAKERFGARSLFA